MTSLKFLFQNLLECPKDKFIWYSYLDKAKEMHKQEIIDAYKRESAYMKYIGCSDEQIKTSAKKYYQETFVSKGSDEHIVDTNEMISDKEILDVAYDKYVIEDEIEAFTKGAKWYREQLKQKNEK